VPITAQAFADYRLGAVTLSAQMLTAVKRLLAGEVVTAESVGMSKREWRELMATLGRDA
jgi:thymidylate synthase (FAD)